eukprot:sb/3476575/
MCGIRDTEDYLQIVVLVSMSPTNSLQVVELSAGKDSVFPRIRVHYRDIDSKQGGKLFCSNAGRGEAGSNTARGKFGFFEVVTPPFVARRRICAHFLSLFDKNRKNHNFGSISIMVI